MKLIYLDFLKPKEYDLNRTAKINVSSDKVVCNQYRMICYQYKYPEISAYWIYRIGVWKIN